MYSEGCGAEGSKIRGFLQWVDIFKATYSDWPIAAAQVLMRSERVRAHLRRGPSVELPRKKAVVLAIVAHYLNGVRFRTVDEYMLSFEYAGKVWSFRGWEYLTPNGIRDYLPLRVEGKRVLDVGASIGESAVLFAFGGARMVVAVEPHPISYSILLENLRLNGVSGAVTAVNAAVGDRDDDAHIKEGPPGSTYRFEAGSTGPIVAVRTLDTLTELYGPFDLVKMDCEGCEYGAIGGASLRGVRELMIEFHHGPEGLLDALIGKGFHCRVMHRRYYYDARSDHPCLDLGYVYAWRHD
jgi:FkbM family methyltransferase